MGLTKNSFRIKFSKRYKYSLAYVNNFNESKYKIIFSGLEEDEVNGWLYALDIGWITPEKLLNKGESKK